MYEDLEESQFKSNSDEVYRTNTSYTVDIQMYMYNKT